MALIGISGKIGSGKDTIGNIITNLIAKEQLPTLTKNFSWDNIHRFPFDDGKYTHWYIKKFADKLKDIVCLLIGCEREQLEDQNFKFQPLDDNWKKEGITTYNGQMIDSVEWLTPRRILQLMGTKCGRDIIHPNIWVNTLFADYRAYDPENAVYNGTVLDYSSCKFPNWIITDVRFPNEARAIESKGGILIRVNRNFPPVDSDKDLTGNHPSETALDNYPKFNHIIHNNGSINELIMVVRDILKKENIC